MDLTFASFLTSLAATGVMMEANIGETGRMRFGFVVFIRVLVMVEVLRLSLHLPREKRNETLIHSKFIRTLISRYQTINLFTTINDCCANNLVSHQMAGVVHQHKSVKDHHNILDLKLESTQGYFIFFLEIKN